MYQRLKVSLFTVVIFIGISTYVVGLFLLAIRSRLEKCTLLHSNNIQNHHITAIWNQNDVSITLHQPMWYKVYYTNGEIAEVGFCKNTNDFLDDNVAMLKAETNSLIIISRKDPSYVVKGSKFEWVQGYLTIKNLIISLLFFITAIILGFYYTRLRVKKHGTR